MTRRGLGLLLLFLFVYLAANYTRIGWLYVITAGLTAVLLLSWVWSLLALRGISMQRTLATAAGYRFAAGTATPVEGGPVTIRLSFSGFRFPRLLVRVTDPTPASGHPHVWFLPLLTPNAEVARQIAWPRRGTVEFAPVTLETAAPFGLFRAHRTFEVRTPLMIYPRWYAAPDERSRAVLHPDVAANPRRGTGGAFLGTREYRPGDAVRTVHWRSSLRRNHLVVKEFEDTAHPALTVVVDASRDLGTAPRSSLDDAARLAAGALRWGMDHGMLVTLAGPDSPRSAVNWQIGMAYLAQVEQDAPFDVQALLTGVPLTSALVVLTPDLAGETARAVNAWRRAGSQVVVLALRGYDSAEGGAANESGPGVLRCGPASDLSVVTALMIAALRQPLVVRGNGLR